MRQRTAVRALGLFRAAVSQNLSRLSKQRSAVMSRVWMSDSLGTSFWMIGSMIHHRPTGTSCVSEMARHSKYAPPSRSWKRQ